MAKSSFSPARRLAFEILHRVEEGAYASVLLASREAELDPLDRGLAHELVMGVLRWQLWLDRLIELYADRNVEKLDPAVRIILRLGLYQLRFLSRVPASAAVNESVNLTKLARLRSAGGLVNAVLRRATREPDIDPAATLEDPVERISVSTSHPAWLIDRWIRAFGNDETEAFARANNEAAPVAFRVVTSRVSETDVCDRLLQAGGTVTPSRITPGAWRITGGGNLLWELSAKGEIYLQDEASQLVALAVAAKAGERVLDLCAAPGSKSTQIADYTRGLATIVASDFHEHRLRTLISSAKTQKSTNVHCVALDGLQPLPMVADSFDRVLVDAPCSGTGTLRRNPEIRWRITASDFADFARRQQALLINASRVIKPGGRLIYSTCSVEPEENEAVVATFLDNNVSFEQAELFLDLAISTSVGSARTWPHRDGSDGFFISALRRKRE